MACRSAYVYCLGLIFLPSDTAVNIFLAVLT